MKLEQSLTFMFQIYDFSNPEVYVLQASILVINLQMPMFFYLYQSLPPINSLNSWRTK